MSAHLSWIPMLTAQVLASHAKDDCSPWSNVSDERYREARELARDRLWRRNETREPSLAEIDFEIETMDSRYA